MAVISSIKSYRMGLIEWLMDSLSSDQQHLLRDKFSETMFIGVQHMMTTEICVFEALIRLGALPQNMIFSGKSYSNYAPAMQTIRDMGVYLMPDDTEHLPGHFSQFFINRIKKMWQYGVNRLQHQNIKNIIILDEGGRCLELMPRNLPSHYNVVAIEQTRGGLYSQVMKFINVPILQPASSVLKRELESPKIIQAFLTSLQKKMEAAQFGNMPVFGVVGVGAIGHTLVNYLCDLGYKPWVYDKDMHNLQKISAQRSIQAASMQDLAMNVNVIFGCTGQDISRDFDFRQHTLVDTVLVSCSSEDKEYKKLLQDTSGNMGNIYLNPLEDITILSENGSKIKILSGGFPINFERKAFSVPAHDIAVTRALMLGSCIQAGDIITWQQTMPFKRFLSIMTDINLQLFIAEIYLSAQSDPYYTDTMRENFKHAGYVKANSGGHCIESEWFAMKLLKSS